MALGKGQSDGIRKRNGTGAKHTISLAGKSEAPKPEAPKIQKPKVEEPVILPERKPIEVVKSAPAAISKPSIRENIFPEDRPHIPPKTNIEKMFDRKGKEETREPAPVPQIEFSDQEIDDDKISSWFFKKKSPHQKEESDFYTGVGFSEEVHEDKGKRTALFKGFAVGSVGLLAVIILLSTVFARATITVKPKVEALEVKDVSVVFDTSSPEVLSKQKIIPAAKLELSKTVSDEFEATGTKTADFKAKGSVRIYNSFNTSPQTLIVRTRFLTDKGVLYRLPNEVVVPAAKREGTKLVAQFIEAEIVADVPGESGNISGEVKLLLPAFQGTPRYDGFYAIAPSGFSSGAHGERKVVTADDRKRASEAVTKRIYDELQKESTAKVPPDFTVVDELRSIDIVKVDVPSVDTVSDKFTASTDANARLIVFREDDVLSFLKGVTSGTDGNRDIIRDTVALTYTPRSGDYARGRADVILGGTVETRISIPEADIKEVIKGRGVSESRESLKSRADVTSSSVSVFPFWLFRIPTDVDKIRVRYE